jgi:hypothetical protein
MVSHVTKGLSLVRGRRLRVTTLDNCGRVIYGDDSHAVSKGFVTVNFTANTTETDEINVTNANGEPCVYEASQQTLAGYTLEIAFCRVDPELASIVTGQPVVIGPDGSTIIGFDIDTKIEISEVNFAFELWMGVKKGDTACAAGTGEKLGYLLLPFLSGGILSDFTVENNAITFTLTGARTQDGNAWGVGPYGDIMYDAAGTVIGPMNSPISTTTALRLIEVDGAAPEAADGARPTLNPESLALTSITAVEGTTDMTADFTTTPAATSPVYWDFGDGSWDYVAAPGATEHEYETAGTYIARAQSNGVWKSTTVVVPF